MVGGLSGPQTHTLEYTYIISPPPNFKPKESLFSRTAAMSARRFAGRGPSVERKKETLGTKGCGHPCARQAASASFTCWELGGGVGGLRVWAFVGVVWRFGWEAGSSVCALITV